MKLVFFVMPVMLLDVKSVCNADGCSQFNYCVADAVRSGSSASVTCHFDRDVSVKKTNFNIQFYPASKLQPVSVLVCNWLTSKPEKPTCRVHDGYQQTGSVNDTAVLEIPTFTKAYEGSYACHLVSPSEIPTRPCNLTIKDDEGDSGLEGSNTHLLIALGVLLGVSFICNVIFSVNWILKRRSQCVGCPQCCNVSQDHTDNVHLVDAN